MIKLLYPKFWSSKNLLARALWPASQIYRFLGIIRKLAVRPIIFPAKVICVGNITIGGTGKTQMVMWLAQVLAARGTKFVIVSKGYGGNFTSATYITQNHQADEVGDEALILRTVGPTIIAKKIQDVVPFLDNFKPEVIIIDDGMQNPGFHKDLTIAVIDSLRGFGNGFLFPAGPLRQYPEEGMSQADIVIVVGNDTIAHTFIAVPPVIQALGSSIHNNTPPIFNASILANTKVDRAKKYLAFTGIGNPERFFASLKNYGLTLVDEQIFPDHHNYSDSELAELATRARALDAALITTAKDYVKISNRLKEVVCFNVRLEIAETEALIKLIYEKIF